MDQWAWVDGESALHGVDLVRLRGPGLFSVLTAMYVRFALQDQDQRKVYNQVVLEFTRNAVVHRPEDPEEPMEPGMFGLREGSMGNVEG